MGVEVMGRAYEFRFADWDGFMGRVDTLKAGDSPCGDGPLDRPSTETLTSAPAVLNYSTRSLRSSRRRRRIWSWATRENLDRRIGAPRNQASGSTNAA